MNKQLDNYLCKKYPKIFAKRKSSMQESCMCWGFSCGNGWFYLIDALCERLQQHIDDPQYIEPKDIVSRLKRLWNRTGWNWIVYPLVKRFSYKTYLKWSKRFQFEVLYIPGPPIPQVVAEQVKEKFAGLRFYVSGGDRYCHNIISFAESLSYRICEDCGRTDELVATSGKGWIQTKCPCHAKDKEHHRKSQNKELIKLWEKVRKEEAKKTEESRMKQMLADLAEVEARSKKKK